MNVPAAASDTFRRVSESVNFSRPGRVAVALAALGLCPAPAHAALELSVAPQSVAVSPGGPAHALVLGTNTGSDWLRCVRVTALASGDDRLHPNVVGKCRTIAAGATVVWRLTISTTDPLTSNGAVTVLARGGRSVAVVAMVEVKPPSTLDVSSLVRVRASPETLEVLPGRKTPARAELSIENLGHESLALTDIDVNAPDKVHYDAHHARPTIAPGATEELKLDVTADGDAQPGDAHAVLLLSFVSRATRVGVAVGQPVKIQTPIPTALLLAIGVPGLALLPGFLVLATSGTLWRFRVWRRQWDTADFPLSFPGPEFWVVAITISIPLAVLASLGGIDLLESHSLRAIVGVWAASVVVGLVAYAVVVPLRNRRDSRRRPSIDDDEVTTLEKLGRRRRPIVLERYMGGTGEAPFFLYVLQPEGDVAWLAPAIECKWNDYDQDLKRDINAVLTSTHDAAEIAKLLAKARKAGSLESVKFKQAGAYGGPIHRALDDLTPEPARSIVHVDV